MVGGFTAPTSNALRLLAACATAIQIKARRRGPSGLLCGARLAEPLRQTAKRINQSSALSKAFFDMPAGVQHGGVIAVKCAADLRERCARQFARKVHREVLGEGDLLRPAPRHEIVTVKAEPLGDHTLEL